MSSRLPSLPRATTPIPSSGAPGTRSSRAAASARWMARSAKSDNNSVARSNDNSPARSPSATVRARPVRWRRSSLSIPSDVTERAAATAASEPCRKNLSTSSGKAVAASARNGAHSRARSSAFSRFANNSAVLVRAFLRENRRLDETRCAYSRSLPTMDAERRNTAAEISMDRRVIRVDVPPAHAGITAALRRAFSPVGADPCEQDFSDLLRKLN